MNVKRELPLLKESSVRYSEVKWRHLQCRFFLQLWIVIHLEKKYPVFMKP
jgi:hypothetical protein